MGIISPRVFGETWKRRNPKRDAKTSMEKLE
jgi:hypothetical protein